MDVVLGPDFARELVANGLNEIVGWNIYTGELTFTSSATDEQKAQVEALKAAYKLPGIDLVAYAKQKRWEREVRGIEVGGFPVSTDDRSKLLIAGARLRAEADPTVTEMWDGVTQLTAPQIIAISDAVGAHVSECFRLQGEVLARIAAGTLTTTAQVDAAYA